MSDDDTTRGDVVWARDPFRDGSNPRPWAVVASSSVPYSAEDSVAVALTTSSHHSDSLRLSADDWAYGNPERQSYALPWSLATLKDETDVVGQQGAVTASFTDRLTATVCSLLGHPPGE